MADQPPQPLPVNPRPNPPQPQTSQGAMRQALLLKLLEDKQRPTQDVPGNLNASLISMGVKGADDADSWLGPDAAQFAAPAAGDLWCDCGLAVSRN